MEQKEYIKTIVFNGHMINIGQDDCGQCYYLEYVDENGDLVIESCGTYINYMDYIEDKFGGCKNCNFCLEKKIGLEVIGLVCGKTYEDIPDWTIVPPCKKKERNHE